MLNWAQSPIPPSCLLIDSRSAGVVHCQNGELDSGMLAEGRRGELRGRKSQKGKGGEREGRAGARERSDEPARLIYGSRSVPKHTCDTNAQGRDRCRSECWVAACHAPILQFTSTLQRNKQSEKKSARQILRWVRGHGSVSLQEFVDLVLDGLDNQS